MELTAQIVEVNKSQERMTPAMVIITSVAQPGLRGTFISLNVTTQALAMGLASTLAGFNITQDASGEIADYGTAAMWRW